MEKWKQFLPYKCVLEGGTGEIVEKRSRFLAEVRRVETEGEAVAFVEEMKKRYWDASHNCSAFVIPPTGKDGSRDSRRSKVFGRGGGGLEGAGGGWGR